MRLSEIDKAFTLSTMLCGVRCWLAIAFPRRHQSRIMLTRFLTLSLSPSLSVSVLPSRVRRFDVQASFSSVLIQTSVFTLDCFCGQRKY